jgi:hypothetical protein
MRWEAELNRLGEVVRIRVLRIWASGKPHALAWIFGHRVGIRSMAWFSLSLIAFALAAELTHRIAYVSHVLAAPYNGNYGAPGTILGENTGWYVFTSLLPPELRGKLR